MDAVASGTALVDTTTESSYTPTDLQFANTYYWKVVEVNEAEAISTWEGALWSFTVQEYGLVDGFEAYDNDLNRIYDTWLDGWVNETGSTVGYAEEPFAERSIVHGGIQSMPLEYDNSSAPFYSEADRTWAGAEDWTSGGAVMLRLYFHGAADNDAESLYVAVEDAAGNVAVVTHDDPDAALVASWQAWSIPLKALADAGVNLTAVKTMYIGLGDRENASSGGAGIIYVDDIAVGTPLGDVTGAGDAVQGRTQRRGLAGGRDARSGDRRRHRHKVPALQGRLRPGRRTDRLAGDAGDGRDDRYGTDVDRRPTMCPVATR